MTAANNPLLDPFRNKTRREKIWLLGLGTAFTLFIAAICSSSLPLIIATAAMLFLASRFFPSDIIGDE